MVLHACLECTVGMVPLQVNATVSGSSPVGFDWVMLLQGCCEVFSIRTLFMADSEIIDNKCEGHGPCLVQEQSRDMLGRDVSTFCKVVFELGVGKLA